MSLPALNKLDTDILILGAGGAGLFAALHAKKAAPDLDVTIAVKGLLGKCGCTRMVKGGVMWFDDAPCLEGARRAVLEVFPDPCEREGKWWVRL